MFELCWNRYREQRLSMRRLLMSQLLSPCGNGMQISTVGLHLVVKNCQSLPFFVMEVLVQLKQMLSDILIRQVFVY